MAKYGNSNQTSNNSEPANKANKIFGTEEDDVLVGSAGIDMIKGRDGDDIITGGAGADKLSGGAGSDTFVYTSLEDGGDAILDFETGDGGDVLDLSALLGSDDIGSGDLSWVQHGDDAWLMVGSDSGADPFITLRDVNVDDWTDANWLLGNVEPAPDEPPPADEPPPPTTLTATVEGQVFTFSSFGPGDNIVEVSGNGLLGVQIVGTAGDDNLDFSATTLTGIMSISGLDGNDTIVGSAESNLINGDGGNDTLWGGGGNDVLVGGAGTDTLTGDAGIDTFVIGTEGAGDVITDFQTGAGGDVLDISALINSGTLQNIAWDDSAADLVLMVDLGAGMEQYVILENTDLTNWSDSENLFM